MKRDPAIWDAKVAQIWQFVDQKRFEDALEISTQLTVQDPGNADGWWPLAVASKGLERWEDARLAVVETIKLVPSSTVIWGTYGEILEAQNKDEEAKKAYEKAIKIEPSYLFGRWRLLALCKKANDYDGMITHGQFLERNSDVGATTLDDIGFAFWYKNNFRMSLQYYKNSVSLEKLSFRYGNLGLIYERPEIAQSLDAYDAYQRALALDANNEKAKEARLRIKQRFSLITQNSNPINTKILTKEKFFRYYINPYVLLGYDPTDNSDDYSDKSIQKYRKLLLHEIDLEGGNVLTLGGHIVDKSRAISLCDELFDEPKKKFNWIVFQDDRLDSFLQKGDASIFFLDDEYFPQATLEALDDRGFLDWISPMFSAQYNLAFSQAMETGTLSTIALLLGGRRYVTQDDEDNCFVGASRILNQRMELIRNAAKDAAMKQPTIKNITEIFSRKADVPPLAGLLNVLPMQFRSYQDEAFRLLREIYLICNNQYNDTALTHSILLIAKSLTSTSLELKHMLETDEKALNELMQKEKARNAHGASRQPKVMQNAPPKKRSIKFQVFKFGAIVALIVGGIYLATDLSNDNAGSGQTASDEQPPQATEPVASSTEEDEPPVGTGQTFTDNEIRYCLSQSIRLNGAQSAMNKYSQADVDRYNALVDDYNSRCASFQYPAGDLQSVQGEVNQNTATLMAQGEALLSK